MKTRVYDRFGGGLIVLIMLTIAVVAGQAQPKFDEPAVVEDVIEMDSGFQITIDHQRHAVLEAPSSEAPDADIADIADSGDVPVQ